jgi:hypothetical protein
MLLIVILLELLCGNLENKKIKADSKKKFLPTVAIGTQASVLGLPSGELYIESASANHTIASSASFTDDSPVYILLSA